MLGLQTRLICPPLDRLEDFVLDRLGDDSPGESNRQTQPSADESTASFCLPALAREPQRFSDKSVTRAADRPAKRQRVDNLIGPSQSSLPHVDRLSVFSFLNPNTIEDVLQTYFEHVHPWIPLVHETSLRRRFLDTKLRLKLDVLMRAMILVSGRYIQRHESVSDISLANLTTEQARSLIVSTAMDCLSVENLQALVICVLNDVRSFYPSHIYLLRDTTHSESCQLIQPPDWKRVGAKGMVPSRITDSDCRIFETDS